MGKKKYFDQMAESREKWIKKNKYYYNFIEEIIKFYVSPDSNVLEIGSGPGNLLGALKNKHKTGVDISPKMVALAKSYDRDSKYILLDIEKKSVKGEFDWVLAINLVGYLDDIYSSFSNIKRAMTSNSRLLVVYYNHLWEPLLRLGEFLKIRSPQPEQNWLSTEDLGNIFKILGFDIIRTDYKLLIPFRVPFEKLINNFLASLPIVRHLSLIQIYVLRVSPIRKKEFATTIVIPARNEAGNIPKILSRIPKFGKWQEIIFIEGHSTDNTWDEIKKVVKDNKKESKNGIYVRGFQQSGQGKADAVRLGFKKARGEMLMILDADMTVHPADLEKFYEVASNGKGEFIHGSRLVYPMEKQAMRFLNKVGNKIFSLMFTYILGQSFKDTLCGTKVLSKKNYEKINRGRQFFGEFDPFGDFDLIFGAVKLSLKVVELPVRYRERTYGRTNISRFRHGLLLLRMSWFAFRKFMFWQY